MSISRRSFVQSLGVLLPVLAACDDAPETEAAAAPPLDDALLLALAETVLPAELGADGARGAATDFATWTAGFQPVVELNHGYGTGELDYSPADPAPGWRAQLQALELEATRRHGRGFAALPLGERQALVRAGLRRDGVERLGDPAAARHVAAGMLAWWYAQPAAIDLCYGARIGRFGCRPLDASPNRPQPLERA